MSQLDSIAKELKDLQARRQDLPGQLHAVPGDAGSIFEVRPHLEMKLVHVDNQICIASRLRLNNAVKEV